MSQGIHDIITPIVSERDRDILLRLGKKPVLKRNFGFLSILGFASTILIAWEAMLISLQYGLQNGGLAGAVYEFVYIWLGVMLTFVVVSELASMAPVSGGQYHYVSMLAPTSMHKFLSYVTGWLTICGWQGNTASALYFSSTQLTGLGVLINPDYQPQVWHQLLCAIGILVLAISVNTRGGLVLPHFEGLMLVLHLLGFFAVLIPLLVIAPKRTTSEVFDTWLNGGNMPTQGVSFLVGTVGTLSSFCGADGAIHMAEEIENAAIVVPRAITLSYIMNGCLAFGMLLATVYSVQDIDQVLSSATGYPYMEVLLQGVGSRAGAAVMVALITIMDICAVVSSMASASRQLWAFARDRGVPGWSVISHVEHRTSVPINAVLLTAIVSLALQCINFGSSTVLEDLVSITVAGLYSSYLVAVVLLLWRRCTGHITFASFLSTDSQDSNADLQQRKVRTLTNTANAPLTWGPWHVPGVYGIVLNAFVCCFLVVSWFWSFFPTILPVTAENMNYNCVLWGGVVLLSIIYYVVWGHKEFTGPIVELDDEVKGSEPAQSTAMQR